MEYSKLNKTKRKLTIIFTLLVLILSIFLEVIFFTYKYYSNEIADNNIFYNQIVNLEQQNLSIE
jgi:hypothetical protein